MNPSTSTTFRVYHVVAGKGHQPITRAGKPLNFRSRETAVKEASKHGPKTLVVPYRPEERA